MSVDTTVYGRTATPSIADRVMQSASLNALPSPTIPAEMVDSPLLNPYMNLVAACYELRKVEQDPQALLEIERARSFAESRITMIEDADEMPQMQITPPPPPPPPQGDAPGGAPVSQPPAPAAGLPTQPGVPQ